MTYKIISTGSKGNAVIINGNILIDCGVAFKKIKPYIKDLRLVLLTHIHSDHFNPATVRALHRERPGLRWGCCEWMIEPLLNAGVSKRCIDVFLPGYQQGYVVDRLSGINGAPEEATIQAVETEHNVRNCCYMIEFPKSNETLFYATDCGTLDGIEAKNYDLYMIDANHTKAEIEARIAEKQAAGAFAYEVRAAQNHLSQEQAIDWLSENAGPNSRYVFLHQHEEKNNA